MTNNVLAEDNDRLSVVGFFIKLWDERLFIGLTLAAGVLVAQAYIFHTPEKYTTTMMVGHVASVESPGASSGGSSGLGGAIALIGLGTGSSNDTKYNLFLTIIRTENFARILKDKYHFEKKRGNTALNTLDEIRGMLGAITIIPAQDTTTLQLQIPDKVFAEQFLRIVYYEGNQFVRIRDTERAVKFAAFIENRFRTESSRPMQDALASLLVNQERFLMVTSVDLPYAVQLVDGPTSSSGPTAPKKNLIRVIGFVVGFAVSIFVILLWDAVASERRTRGFTTPTPSNWLRSLATRTRHKPAG